MAISADNAQKKISMESKVKYFENRKDWRKWLSENFDTVGCNLNKINIRQQADRL